MEDRTVRHLGFHCQGSLWKAITFITSAWFEINSHFQAKGGKQFLFLTYLLEWVTEAVYRRTCWTICHSLYLVLNTPNVYHLFCATIIWNNIVSHSHLHLNSVDSQNLSSVFLHMHSSHRVKCKFTVFFLWSKICNVPETLQLFIASTSRDESSQQMTPMCVWHTSPPPPLTATYFGAISFIIFDVMSQISNAARHPSSLTASICLQHWTERGTSHCLSRLQWKAALVFFTKRDLFVG